MFYKHNFYRFTGAVVANLCLFQAVMAHGISEADRELVLQGGNFTYMQLGATHMLTGYDHLLFVFGIIFFLRTFRDIVKYVTAFTIGHSVTLIFATFNEIQINYFWSMQLSVSVCAISDMPISMDSKIPGYQAA